MKYIDINSWSRKNQYENFIKYTNPTFSVCSALDVTKLVTYCQKNNISFFSSFMYIVANNVNKVKEMRLRLKDDKVVSFERTHPSYVVLCNGDELRTCKTAFSVDFSDFYSRTQKDIILTKTNKPSAFNKDNGTDCFYISSLPWIKFSSITNPYNYQDKEQTSIPRITWGRFYKTDQGFEINFDVSVHHALVDGVHVSNLIKNIENQLNTLDFLEDNNEG